jgi:hypothetical protein
MTTQDDYLKARDNDPDDPVHFDFTWAEILALSVIGSHVTREAIVVYGPQWGVDFAAALLRMADYMGEDTSLGRSMLEASQELLDQAPVT